MATTMMTKSFVGLPKAVPAQRVSAHIPTPSLQPCVCHPSEAPYIFQFDSLLAFHPVLASARFEFPMTAYLIPNFRGPNLSECRRAGQPHCPPRRS